MRVHPDDRKKKHHAKSRHGCISCKKRHLKCDEGRPGCTRCINDFGKCEGYQTPRTWLFEPEPSPHTENTIVLNSNDATTSSPTSITSRATLIRQGSDTSQTDSTSPEPEHQRQKRWAPKSRSGCITCKKRRIKCDEARPSCSRCALSSRNCEYQAPPTSDSENASSDNVDTLVSSPELMRHRSSSEDSLGHTAPIFLVNSSPYKTQTDYQTFSHWLGRAESCSVISRCFGSFNILGVELPKMAWHNKSVRHGLLAAASVTASLERFSLNDDNDKKTTITALKHSSLAINSLLTEDANLEVMVVVAFVFWFMEAWVGSWARAVMHLASAARMSKEGLVKGQVSEAVAWYVNVCDEAVPCALRDQEFLHNTHDSEYYTKSQMLCLRLRYGVREIETGIGLIDDVAKQAIKTRPNDYGILLEPLLDHSAQMKWLLDSIYRKHHALCGACAEAEPPPSAYPPIYSRVAEQISYFLSDDPQYDGLLLFIRLKLLQRSIPLFVAGTDMEIRRDAAMSIPMKALVKEESSPELYFASPEFQSPEIKSDPLMMHTISPQVAG